MELSLRNFAFSFSLLYIILLDHFFVSIVSLSVSLPFFFLKKKGLFFPLAIFATSLKLLVSRLLNICESLYHVFPPNEILYTFDSWFRDVNNAYEISFGIERKASFSFFFLKFSPS